MKRRKVYFLAIPALIIIVIFDTYPLFLSLQYSLTDMSFLKMEGNFIGLGNYVNAFNNPKVINAIKLTLFIVLIGVGIQTVLALIFAMLLCRKDIRGKDVFRTLLIIPMLTAPIVVGLQYKFMLMQDFGVVNHILISLGIISNKIPWLTDSGLAKWSILAVEVLYTLPFLTFVFLAGLESLPREPFEAAEIDGASWWQRFWYITLPMLSSVMAFGVVLRLFNAYQLYDTVYFLTGGGPVQTTEVLSFCILRLGFRHFMVGRGCAVGMIALMVAIPWGLGLLLQQRHLYTYRR